MTSLDSLRTRALTYTLVYECDFFYSFFFFHFLCAMTPCGQRAKDTIYRYAVANYYFRLFASSIIAWLGKKRTAREWNWNQKMNWVTVCECEYEYETSIAWNTVNWNAIFTFHFQSICRYACVWLYATNWTDIYFLIFILRSMITHRIIYRWDKW